MINQKNYRVKLNLSAILNLSEYYKTLLFDFKGSLHSVEVRKRYRSIRGDASDEEKDDL